MKKILLTAVVLAGLSTSVGVYAQGTVLLENSTGGLIYVGADNSTPLAADVNAELLGGMPGGSLAPLVSIVGSAASGITVDFGRIFDPSGLARAVPGVTPGQNANLQLRLWMGSATDYAGAVTAGAFVADSGPFLNPTGGVGTPPSLPAGLVALPAMHLTTTVPEPSMLALAGLGAVSLLMYRRRTA